MKTYFVYIMANEKKTIYTGMTNDLRRRVSEHKQSSIPGFTKRHGLNKLVYCETFREVRDAIGHEKRIKGWLRKRKVALIEAENPDWDDLSETWDE